MAGEKVASIYNALMRRGECLTNLGVSFLMGGITLSAAEIPFALPGVDISKGTVSGVTSVDVGDINRDGLPDIAVFEGGKHASGRQVFAWFEAPDWTRHSFSTEYEPGSFVGDSKLADVDEDGYLDLVLPQDSHTGGPGYLYWYKNPQKGSTGNWSRTLIDTWRDAFHIGELEVADMDRDGKLDVVVRHLGTKNVRICFQNSPTDWTTRTFPVRHREGLLLGDLDRDGMTDILLNGFWWAAPSNPRTGDWEEFVIDKAFYTQPEVSLNNSIKAGFADLDGDGLKDVVMVPAEGEKEYLAWYKCPSNPRTESWERHIIESNWGNMHQVEIGDFDQDGDLDIAGGLSFGDEGIYIWRNENNGESWARQTLSSNDGMYSGIAYDIGADGDLDIVGPSFYSKTSRPLLYENLSQAIPDQSAYERWVRAYEFSEGDDEKTSDPDLDFIPNFLEFALGNDPLKPDSNIGMEVSNQVIDEKSYLTLQFNRALEASDLRFFIQTSNDLQNWSDAFVDYGGTTQSEGLILLSRVTTGVVEQIVVRSTIPLGEPGSGPDFFRFLVADE